MTIFNKIWLTSFMTLLVLTTSGQTDCCWFGDKPTTSLDSLTIKRKGITTIKIYHINTATDSLQEKVLIRSFEISKCKSKRCPQVIKTTTTNKKIVQILEWNHVSGWNMEDTMLIRCELTHQLDNNGRIIKTKSKYLKGIITEDFAFSKIVYKYEGNLVKQADYYMEYLSDEEILYLSVIYEYE